MSTNPTSNPIPSESPRDLKFNAGKIDEIVNSPEDSYRDRFGKGRLTWTGIENITTQSIISYGYVLIDSFQAGATITSRNQALRDEDTGLYFRWNGTLPKSVPSGSTPSSTGGISDASWVAIGTATLSSTDIDAGDALIAVIQPVTGAAIRTQHDKNSDTYSILDFEGADGSGLTDSTVAFTSAMVSGRTVHIPSGANISISPSSPVAGHLIIDGNLIINATCTIDSSVTVRSGNITVNAGCNVSFNSSFAANSGRRIFIGSGNVYGIRHVEPEWWGAVADNSADCGPALNSASLCVQNSSGVNGETRPSITLMSGQYRINSTWYLPSSANIGLEVKGQGIIFAGTRVVASSSFTGDHAVLMPGLTDGTQRIMDFKIHGLGIVPQSAGSGPLYGLTIGSSGNMVIGLKESIVSDIFISNFRHSLHVVNARLIKFERVGIWNDGMSTASNCLFIESQDKFCGDMTFHNCQFVNKQSVSGSRCILIDSSGTYVSTGDQAYHIAGIRLTECIIYPAETSVSISSNNGAHVDDIFFTTCQWDGDSSCMLLATAGDSSEINDIQIVNNYMYGGNKTSDAQIQFLTNGTGLMKNIRVTGNTIGAGVGRVVNLSTSASDSITGATVSENHIVDFNNASNAAIEFGGGCTRFACNNNVAMRNAGVFYPYLVQIDAGCNYYVVTGNIGAGIVSSTTIREVSPGANRIVANNL